jgi:hypothetical protein
MAGILTDLMLERVAKAREEVAKIRRFKYAYDEVIANIREELSDEEFAGVTFSIAGSGFDISCFGNKDFLVRMMRAIRKAQFEPGIRPEENATSYCSWFNRGGAQLWFTFHSNQCKRVQVGTEMVERPVYEVRCE